jgi:quinol monooxygenase YgiN
MYARVVEVTIKPQHRENLLNLVRSELQPTLLRQPGFVDMVGLISESDPNKALGITFWQSKEQAERFMTSPAFLDWQQRVRPHYAAEPKGVTYSVDQSTFHKIASGKAA